MRIIRNGPKQHIYFSASERRALKRALWQVRCPSCSNHHVRPAYGYRAISCFACGWWASLGKDVFISYSRGLTWNGNPIVKVESIQDAQQTMLYQVHPLYRSENAYGGDIALG